MITVTFINRYYRPDHSATAQILTDLAEHLAAGMQVRIVTSRQSYSDSKLQLPPTETLSNVHIVRLWGSRFGRDRLAGRACDYLSFYVSCFFYLLFALRRGEVVVAKTDPPLISIIAELAAKARGATLINWLQDLFPEVAQAIGIRGIPPLVFRALTKWRDRALRMAFANVAIGERMATRLRVAECSPQKIHVIPNWVIQRDIRPLAPALNPLRNDWQLQSKFIIGYSGNLGRAHDYRTMFEAAVILEHKTEIAFVFIGDGAGMQELKLLVTARGLRNVYFKPYQPIDKLAFSLTLPDLHLATLEPALEGLIVPSKLYGILAAGRPTLFIGAVDGEIGELLRANNCGYAVAPGDSITLANHIQRLSLAPDELELLGNAAERAHRTQFRAEVAIAHWQQLIESAGRTNVLRGEASC